jgi:hypothetical protein
MMLCQLDTRKKMNFDFYFITHKRRGEGERNDPNIVCTYE